MCSSDLYFANVGDTRRQGVEASAGGRYRTTGGSRLDWSLHYTLMRATFETPFTALSAAHPDAVDGAIQVPAGAHLPGVPNHVGKAGVSFSSHEGYSVGASVVANSSQYLRGDEANHLSPLAGYVVVNARAGYRVCDPLSLVLLVDNVFDARTSTFGVVGNAREVLGPTYSSPRFVGPGAPRGMWLGVELQR